MTAYILLACEMCDAQRDIAQKLVPSQLIARSLLIAVCLLDVVGP